jgi:ABC-2 type transport system ATP-binding protein
VPIAAPSEQEGHHKPTRDSAEGAGVTTDPGDRLTAAVTAEPLIRLDGLTKRYPGTTALDDLNVEMPRGSIGLVGANGAGKTTTFRLLLGLAHPTDGRVEVCGLDVARDPIGVRSRLGYMPEHDCLPLDQSASDVVATFGELSGLPARASRQRASDILELVGLDEARFRPIGEFSTGMRQRTKLAQAIVSDPELVLLDEPTSGLDPAGRDDMLALIARLGTFGISVLMATHLLDDVQKVCDYVVMIDGGRLVVAGTTNSLLERTGTVSVDVGPAGETLVAALHSANFQATLVDGIVEVASSADDDLDTLRNVIAQLELPLYRLSTRVTSLDEVFLRRAEAAS